MRPDTSASLSGSATAVAGRLRLRHSLAWLTLLAPLFFLSYGWANRLAASRGVMESLVFGWERWIPFLPWSILPYWSIDLMYGLSFLACRTPREVNHQGLRLLTAQLVSVAFFLAFPLRFSGEKPATEGLFGRLFDALAGFDLPYNQAPSLHISLLVIITFALLRRAGPLAQGGWLVWAVTVAVSVLTTWQHHFFDLPTGLLVGLLSLWLWPEQGESPLVRLFARSARHPRLAGLYALGAGICIWIASRGGWALLAIWPAVSLLLVALNYAGAGVQGFQKAGGRQSFAVRWMMAPYRLGAWLNSRFWTRRHPTPDRVSEQVWIGRIPRRAELAEGGFDGLLDLTAEFNTPRAGIPVFSQPMLDVILPEAEQLRVAALTLEALHHRASRILVCCALGYSRSALTLAAWLLLSGRCPDAKSAIQRVLAHRSQARLDERHCRLLESLHDAVH